MIKQQLAFKIWESANIMCSKIEATNEFNQENKGRMLHNGLSNDVKQRGILSC